MAMGIAAFQEGTVLTISPESWAPGLWAGTEGYFLDNGAQIAAVDLSTRVLYLDTSQVPYNPGEEIRMLTSSYVEHLLKQTVAEFSYKPECKLSLTQELNGKFRLSLKTASSGTRYGNFRTFSLLNSGLTKEKVRQYVFEMVQALEREIIIKSLKFRGQQYLTDSPR
jgi:hypothetical protein